MKKTKQKTTTTTKKQTKKTHTNAHIFAYTHKRRNAYTYMQAYTHALIDTRLIKIYFN